MIFQNYMNNPVCICRSDDCLLERKCLTNEEVYQASVKTDSWSYMVPVGATEKF